MEEGGEGLGDGVQGREDRLGAVGWIFEIGLEGMI